jgi:hypothetical protein
MNIEIKLWKISNNQISPVEDSSLAVERLEDDLACFIREGDASEGWCRNFKAKALVAA